MTTNNIFSSAIVLAMIFAAGCQEAEVKTSVQSEESITASASSSKQTQMVSMEPKAGTSSRASKIEKGKEQSIPAKVKTASQNNSTSPVSVASKNIKIEVIKAVHDFGELSPDTYNNCSFKFRNAGTETLKIEKVQSTCGCSVPKLDKMEYKPGEEGEVEVRFHAPSRKGSVVKHLYIVSNDVNNPRAELELKANVVVMVEVSPEKVTLAFDEDNAGIVPIKVKSIDNVLFTVTGFKASSQAITAEFNPKEKSTEHVLNPKVDTELLSKNPVGSIIISVDHPKAKDVFVQYTMKPRFVVSRPRIILQNAAEGMIETKDVMIKSNYGEKVEIKSTSSENGLMELLETIPVEGDALKLMIQITVPPQGQEARRYFSDKMDIKLTNGYETEVRVSGWYKR